MGNIEERDDAAVRVAEALWPQKYVGDVTTAEWERCYAVVDAANGQLRGAVEALQFFADGGTYEEGGRVRAVPWPLQARAREALAAMRGQ